MNLDVTQFSLHFLRNVGAGNDKTDFLAELIFVGKWFSFFYVATNSYFRKIKEQANYHHMKYYFLIRGKTNKKLWWALTRRPIKTHLGITRRKCCRRFLHAINVSIKGKYQHIQILILFMSCLTFFPEFNF